MEKECRKNWSFFYMYEYGDVYDNALLVEGVKPRVMLACHCHSSTEACRAHNLPKQKQGVRETYL